MTKARLFISHVSTEADLAQLLKEQLVADFGSDLDVFVSSDRNSADPGRDWLLNVRQALEQARVVIVLCSEESLARPWVNFEMGAAWIRQEVRLIPVCHSGLVPERLPVQLNLLNALEAGRDGDLSQLYRVVAEQLGVAVPRADFAPIVEGVRRFEQRYGRARQARERIEHPRILCAASEPYADPQLGFEQDVAAVERWFPGCVRVERRLTSRQLRQLLTTERFDVVHLVQAVNPNNGELIFDPVEPEARRRPGDRVDKMTAANFADFVRESGTLLVVLNTCQALYLAARVAPAANMVATHIDVDGETASAWANYFYEFLADGRSLYDAFERTCSEMNDVPMALIRHCNFSISPRDGSRPGEST